MSEHELWNELGNLYFLSGSYGQAVNAYRRSIKLDAGFGRPYSNLALTYVQQGKYEEAIELYRASIELLADAREKAISWNRLGAVYRHLKDYSKAVIAFQEADDLDPLSAEEFPAQDTDNEVAVVPSSVLNGPAAEQTETKAEVEWWDVDETRLQSVAAMAEPSAIFVDDPTASWTPADASQFQQDLSQTPETGSLTTWGDADLEDEFEVLSPLDPAPDFDVPDPDDERLSTWLPMPEEEPASLDQIQVPPFYDEIQPEPDLTSEWNESLAFHVIDSSELGLSYTPNSRALGTAEITERSESAQSSQQVWEPREVDVDVEERPAADISPIDEQVPEQLVSTFVEPPIPVMAAVSSPEPLPAPEPPALDHEDEDAREIEIGIAKYRRVVQLNPRNAHAWDALGTLFKSAGLYKDAILAYQQAIANDSSKSLYYHHLGLVYACEGRDEDAISAFQRVIEIDPEYSLAHATLGGYYRKMGLEELAQKHIGKAMKNIFDSENEYNRACLEAICGNADQAIELLGVALKNKQTYVDWILRDPDLDFIRQDPRFKQLISDYTR